MQSTSGSTASRFNNKHVETFGVVSDVGGPERLAPHHPCMSLSCPLEIKITQSHYKNGRLHRSGQVWKSVWSFGAAPKPCESIGLLHGSCQTHSKEYYSVSRYYCAGLCLIVPTPSPGPKKKGIAS